MTSKLKCPFCQKELGIILCDIDDFVCSKCRMCGSEKLWIALIQAKQDLEIARKALEIATNALEKYADEDMWETGHRWEVDYIQALFLEQGYKIAKEALEEINRKQD